MPRKRNDPAKKLPAHGAKLSASLDPVVGKEKDYEYVGADAEDMARLREDGYQVVPHGDPARWALGDEGVAGAPQTRRGLTLMKAPKGTQETRRKRDEELQDDYDSLIGKDVKKFNGTVSSRVSVGAPN